MNLEVACLTAPASTEKEEAQQLLDDLATRVPLWDVVENKHREIRREVEKAHTEKLNLQATMGAERKAERAAARAAGKFPVKKQCQPLELTPTSEHIAQGPLRPGRHVDPKVLSSELESGKEAGYINEEEEEEDEGESLPPPTTPRLQGCSHP